MLGSAQSQDTGSLIVSASTKPVAMPTPERNSSIFQVKPAMAGSLVIRTFVIMAM